MRLFISDTVGDHAGYPNLVQCSLLPRFHIHSGCDVPIILVGGSGSNEGSKLLEVKFFWGTKDMSVVKDHKRSYYYLPQEDFEIA